MQSVKCFVWTLLLFLVWAVHLRVLYFLVNLGDDLSRHVAWICSFAQNVEHYVELPIVLVQILLDQDQGRLRIRLNLHAQRTERHMQVALAVIINSKHRQHILRRSVNDLNFAQQPSLFRSLEHSFLWHVFVILLIAAVHSHETVMPEWFGRFWQVRADEITVVLNSYDILASQVGCWFGI